MLRDNPMRIDEPVAKAPDPADKAAFTIMGAAVPEVLTKRFELVDGKLLKREGGNLVAGHAQVVRVASIDEFAQILMSLDTNMALAHGVPAKGREAVDILMNEEWQRRGKPETAIARTRKCMKWPEGRGFMMIDCDAPDVGEPLVGDDLLQALAKAVPALADVALVYWPSASSCIFNSETGEQLRGVRGQRIYLMVENARDIPRAGEVLGKRLWLAGFGRIEISSNGNRLKRTLVDLGMWDPERLDFAAGAACKAPLEQRRGAPVIYEGSIEVVDTKTIFPDLTSSEESEFNRLLVEAMATSESEAEAIKEAWLTARADEMTSKGADKEAWAINYKAAKRVLEGGDLPSEFLIHVVPKEGPVRAVTVAEIVANAQAYHRMQTLDPQEPDYRDGKVVGMIFNTPGGVRLTSMAHGPKTYKLSAGDLFGTVTKLADKMREVWGEAKFDEMMLRQAERAAAADAESAKAARRHIKYAAHRASDAIDETFDYLREHPDFFGFGDHVARVSGGEVIAFTDDDTLRYEIGREVVYETEKPRKDGTWETVPIKAPAEIARTVVKSGKRAGLRPLKAVVDVPTLRRDGSILSEPGYDPGSELFYAPSGAVPHVPEFPTRAEVAAALETLFHPFKEFSYVSPADRGVLLALALSAVIRTSLPTAPGFLLEAPDKGAGKTLMATMGAALTGKRNPDAVMTGMPKEDEFEKRIAAALLVGERAMIIDNIMGSIKGATLAALLTSGTFAGRRLNYNEQLELPNRMMVLFSGNNVDVSEDLVRRVYTCRIDPGREKPELRTFELVDPLGYVKRHRSEMVAAALTLIRGRLTLGPAVLGGPVGSFEDWARLVRDTVLWIGLEFDPAFGDPQETVERKRADDPEREAVRAGLAGLRAIFGDSEFTAAEAFDVLWRRSVPRLMMGGKVEKSPAVDNATLEGCRMAWEAITGEPPKSARVLGSFWNHRKDRHVAGVVLRRCGVNSAKVAMWRVEEVAA